MKRKFSILLSLAIIVSVCYAGLALHTAAANVSLEGDRVRVVIGNTSDMTTLQARSYNNIQSNTLAERASSAPNNFGKALVAFGGFLEPEVVNQILDGRGIVTSVYIWEQNKTGRAIIDVQDNDIIRTIDSFFSSLELDNEPDSQYKQDMLSLLNNYGVFAVEVTDTYQNLENLASDPNVSRVDLVYNEQAETLALNTKRSVSYVCIPAKPDGTV